MPDVAPTGLGSGTESQRPKTSPELRRCFRKELAPHQEAVRPSPGLQEEGGWVTGNANESHIGVRQSGLNPEFTKQGL